MTWVDPPWTGRAVCDGPFDLHDRPGELPADIPVDIPVAQPARTA